MPFMLVLAYFTLQRGRDVNFLGKARVLAEQEPGSPGTAAGPPSHCLGKGCTWDAAVGPVRNGRQCARPPPPAHRPGVGPSPAGSLQPQLAELGAGSAVAAVTDTVPTSAAEGRADQGAAAQTLPMFTEASRVGNV